MSNVTDHRAKAEHNENLASTLPEIFSDWAVTMLFYSAMHYFEAYFAKEKPPRHNGDHTKRDNAIASTKFLKPLWKDYRELKNQSRNARYEAHITFSKIDVTTAVSRLTTIKKTILTKL